VSAPAAAAAAARPRWRQVFAGNVLAMGLANLFTDFSSEMIYPLLPVFLSGLVAPGAAAVAVGLMEGIGETTAALLKIASGAASDVLRRRKLLVLAGYGLSTVCRPLMAFAGAASHVVALRFGDRVGKGIRTSPRDALLSESVEPGVRAFAFSFHRAMDHLGAILGPLAAVGILYALLGRALWHGSAAAATPAEMAALRRLFAFAIVPGVLAMVALFVLVRDPARPASAVGGAAARAAVRLPRRFYGFVAAVTLFALGNSSDLFLVFLARTRFGFGLLPLIGLWVFLHGSKALFSLPGGWLADRYGRRPAILAGWAVYAAVYLGFAFASGPAAFWALLFVYGAYYGLTEGAEKALVADFVPPEARGRAFGIYHGAIGLAALPASLLFGVFWARLGPAVAFGIGAALAGLAALALAAVLAVPRPGEGGVR
jgi:MFS family permease